MRDPVRRGMLIDMWMSMQHARRDAGALNPNGISRGTGENPDCLQRGVLANSTSVIRLREDSAMTLH